MGSGLGSAQRAVVSIYQHDPDARLTVAQVAGRVYPGDTITRSHTNNINRVLHQLAPVLNLTRSRVCNPGSLGWRHVWGKRK